MKRFLLISFFSSLFFLARAQDGHLVVQVLDPQGDPAAFAAVEIRIQDSTLITQLANDQGFTSLSFTGNDPVQLTTTWAGFRLDTFLALGTADDTVILVFRPAVIESACVEVEPEILSDCSSQCGVSDPFQERFLPTRWIYCFGGVYFRDGRAPTFGNFLNLQPYD